MINALSEIKLSSLEYAFLVEDTIYTSDTFKMWLPKLMPLIPRGAPRKSNTAIDNNIFINDVKPQTSSSISTMNYLVIPRFKSADFTNKKNGSDNIPKDSKFIIAIMNGNIKDMYVTDNI